MRRREWLSQRIKTQRAARSICLTPKAYYLLSLPPRLSLSRVSGGVRVCAPPFFHPNRARRSGVNGSNCANSAFLSKTYEVDAKGPDCYPPHRVHNSLTKLASAIYFLTTTLGPLCGQEDSTV